MTSSIIMPKGIQHSIEEGVAKMEEEKKIWENMMDKRGIRNAARAVIIQGNRLLCTKNEDPLGIFYLFPGGGQKKGETLKETLKRECQEEVGAVVQVGSLLYIREYIGDHHEFAEYDSGVHQVEFFFTCKVISKGHMEFDKGGDSFQIGEEWLPLETLTEYRIYPKKLSYILPLGQREVYLGDIN